jgi:ABC-type amino acid transport substrate-binding protein
MRSAAKPLVLTGALLAGIVAVAALCGACGSAKTAGAGATGLEGSAAERAQTILGHVPVGRAKTIVSRGVLVVADDGDYPPQSYVDAKTKGLVGFDVDVAKAAAAVLGLKVKFVHPAAEQVAAGLRKGSCDVAIDSTPRTRQNQKSLAFSKPYYYTLGEVFMKKGGLQVAGPAGLADKTVGVAADSVFYDYLKGNTSAIVKAYTTDGEIVSDLAAGKIDYWMTAAQVGTSATTTQPIALASPPLYHQALAFATKPGETDLAALLDAAIARMRSSGQLRSLSKRWYGLDLTVVR